MDYEHLTYEQDGHVVTLVHDRPDQHNAINRAMAEELHHAWQRFRDDDDAFVLVITGAGETTFCAGWDLAEAAALEEVGDFDRFRSGLYNDPGPCRLHASGRRVQAGDRRRQRLRVRRGAGDRAAG